MLKGSVNKNSPESKVKELISLISKCKSLIDKENAAYDKGTVGIRRDMEPVMTALAKSQKLYDEVLAIKNFNEIVSEPLRKVLLQDHEALSLSLKDYEINIRAALKVNNAVISAAKNSMAAETKHEQGYNSKGRPSVSGKKIVENTPAIAINNKI